MGITNLHDDIIQTHILTRLDGRTLAAAGCASSHLQNLCSGEKLWSDICSSSWPSTEHPLVTQAISNFTSGHRSFFSDAFPSPSPRRSTAMSSPPTPQFISSVDLRYHDRLLFSKVESTDGVVKGLQSNGFRVDWFQSTRNTRQSTPDQSISSRIDWFQSTPFRIDWLNGVPCFKSTLFRVDLMEPKELVQTGLKVSGDDRVMQSDLEKYMTLSWILIDPTQNRAVNLSSGKPVSVERNWLTDELELTFASVTAGDSADDHVSCNIEVTCGVNGGSLELYVSGVSLTVQDIDGRCMNGKDSMVILQGLMVAERRWCGGGGEWRKEKYEEYVRRRRERKENMERRERRLDLVRVACGVAFLMAFWSFALY